MVDPLKIMDEIENDHIHPVNGSVLVPDDEWQSLRADLERQAEELAIAFRMSLPGDYEAIRRPELDALREELAHIETELSAGQGDDDGDQILPDFREDATTAQKVGECLHLLEVRRDVIAAVRKREAQKEARIARLEGALKDALDVVTEMDDHSEAGFCEQCGQSFHWIRCGEWGDSGHECSLCSEAKEES